MCVSVCECVCLSVCMWMRLAAGFLLFSKCFCRCCSCTLRANPEPSMPCRHNTQLLTVCASVSVCISVGVYVCVCLGVSMCMSVGSAHNQGALLTVCASVSVHVCKCISVSMCVCVCVGACDSQQAGQRRRSPAEQSQPRAGDPSTSEGSYPHSQWSSR